MSCDPCKWQLMPVPAETIKKGVKLKAMEGSQAIRKRTNFRRELLYRLLGGRLVYRLKTHYKLPKRTSEIPHVIGGSSQLLIKSHRPSGLDKGKLLENYGRGLDKQACQT